MKKRKVIKKVVNHGTLMDTINWSAFFNMGAAKPSFDNKFRKSDKTKGGKKLSKTRF